MASKMQDRVERMANNWGNNGDRKIANLMKTLEEVLCRRVGEMHANAWEPLR